MEPAYDLRVGDCLDPSTGLASLADRSVDHCIQDPPYEAEAHTLQRRVKRGSTQGVSSDERVAKIEEIGFAPITEIERQAVGRETSRISRRWSLTFCQVEASHKWAAALGTELADYVRTCVWVKPDGMPQLTGDRPGMGYESIVACHAIGAKRWNGGGRVGVFEVNKGGDERAGHPTQKPLALMEMLIRLFTDPGDLICDPFMGSGTTGVAAIRLGRRFVGWEKDPKYFAIAQRRISNAREQLDLLGGVRAAKMKQESLIR